MDVFKTEQTRDLLRNKNVVVIGDSVQRSVYKDMVSLIHQHRHLTKTELRAKGELTFQDDTLTEGGQKDGLHNGVSYIEARKFAKFGVTLSFYFVTRCYSDYITKVLSKLQASPPDVVIMNSCLWDLHRYGPHGPAAFKKNLRKLMEDLKKKLPNLTFIWTATLPVAKSCKAGFLQVGEYPSVQSNEIIEANFVAFQIVEEYGRIFLNFNSYFCQLLHHREKDGVHWNGIAHRRMTNMLLTEISKLWGKHIHIPFVQEPPSLLRHHRSASLPELWFSRYINTAVCRQNADAISMCHPPNFVHNRIRPPFAKGEVVSTRALPSYSGSLVGDQFLQSNAQTSLQQPRLSGFTRHPIADAVAKCFAFAKKRCHSDVERINFLERPAKRPCIRPDSRCSGGENYFPVAARPNWCPTLLGQSSWWYNTANVQQQPQNSRYVENYQWLEPNATKPSRKHYFTQRIRSWYKSNFQKLKNEFRPLQHSTCRDVDKNPVESSRKEAK